MKANKTLKRLAKIEALLSDIKARYAGNTSDIRQVLQDAGIAITRAKEIVSSQAAAKTERRAKKAAPVQKKPGVKKAATKRAISKSANKAAPRKKVAKRKAARVNAADVAGAVTNIG
jgi:hypothetical protein